MSSSTQRHEIQIREGRAEDSPALARLSAQLGYPVSPEVMAGRFAATLRVPASIVLVAHLLPGEVVGFGQFLHQHLLESESRVEVAALVVDGLFRGLGVGRLLLARAEQWARERGSGIIHLRSNVTRAAAHTLYEMLGYTHFKTQKAFRKELK